MVKRFVMQWHLSEVCNLRCKHCYQEKHIPIQLELDKLLIIYNQFKNLLIDKKMKGHINLTGGEPLCNPCFFNILEEIEKDKELISFCILTNGTLIDDSMAKKIKSYNPVYVQVSLEGGKKTNDNIRGKGTYKKIGDAIKILRDNNIFTSVSFTVTSNNYKEFPKVVKYAKKCGANSVWSDRYIPLGDNQNLDLVLNKEETQKYIELMNKVRNKLIDSKSRTIVTMNRALQFQATNNIPYRCTAGDTLLTVMENGDLVPCRRMPIVVGNLFNDNMLNLYETNKFLKELREYKEPDECLDCEDSVSCNGGLKCLTYALFKDLNNKDIGCNLSNK